MGEDWLEYPDDVGLRVKLTTVASAIEVDRDVELAVVVEGTACNRLRNKIAEYVLAEKREWALAIIGYFSATDAKAASLGQMESMTRERWFRRCVHSNLLMQDLLRTPSLLTVIDLERFLHSFFATTFFPARLLYWDELIARAKEIGRTGLNDTVLKLLERLYQEKVNCAIFPHDDDLKKLIGFSNAFPDLLYQGESWLVYLRGVVSGSPEVKQNCWTQILKMSLSKLPATPSAKWLRNVSEIADALGQDAPRVISECFARTLLPRKPLLLRPYFHAYEMSKSSAQVLAAFTWVLSLHPSAEVARVVGGGCASALRVLPGIGPRAGKWANACVWLLGEMAGSNATYATVALAQLVKLGSRVRHKPTLKMIEKAKNAAAAKLRMTREDLDEIGVPEFGFAEVGSRVEEFEEGVKCTLKLAGSDVTTTWTNAAGKVIKTVPANVKTKHKETLKELKEAAKDVQGMLSAQRERLDKLMGSTKTWAWPVFCERYLDHPIIGAMARKLIWIVDGKPVVRVGGKLQDVNGKEVTAEEKSVVGVWHPIGKPVAEVLAWRERLEVLNVVQPFKQAYREVYLLTEAEVRTAVYSNRFAGHVIRQHQFHALAALRGWNNKLRLMVDANYPPATKILTEYGLRAEWWIEGAGDGYGTDTNESGAYLRLTTDQLRFYRIGAEQRTAHAAGGGYGVGRDVVDEPLPLESVPPLAFSEVMRDVDLFVGVASVGNDPNWQDGGAEGQYRDYWQQVSFGDLSASAQTRREVLGKLLPRMSKLAGKWELTDKFLKVKGKLRGYKIHLGSSNILMEPNDQYLCIVPARNVQRPAGLGYVPFEGDERMSVILSKALMLVEDDAITDVTITRQIGR